MASHPLAGLRVLDLSRVVSGPFAGRMLSDLGADVVKLEPPDGDRSRTWGEVRHGLSGFYTQQNAGKRNVCIDLARPGGRDAALALAAAADVVIENFRPGVLDRLGLGWPVLHDANPRLVLLSISGFGQTGADSGRQAYAPIVHAESGFVARQARADGTPPSDPVLSVADYDAGLHGLVAVLAALWMRERTGAGQHIDLSMLAAMLATDDYAHHALDGSEIVRLGGEVWQGPEGPLMIAAAIGELWRALRTVVEIEDLTPDGADRETTRAFRRASLEIWMAGLATQQELYDVLTRARVPWASVREPERAFDQPGAAGMIAEVDDRGGGLRRVVQSPYRFSAAAAGVRGPAPYRGEHNREVLAEWAGWDGPRLDALEASGALCAEARPDT